jgi:hypothetical protein
MKVTFHENSKIVFNFIFSREGRAAKLMEKPMVTEQY